MKVTVITTVLNEAASTAQLLQSLSRQSRQPDEIVIADAGSTDGTLDVLETAQTQVPKLRVIDGRGNRSKGRNAAISAATGEVIACIDGGCVPASDWLEKLVTPFAGGATWAAGFYAPDGGSALSQCIGLVMVYVEDELRASEEPFLPSARSMAFTKTAWSEVGGFPEEVDFAEDSLFDERLLKAGHVPVPAYDAIVLWHPPPDLATLAATAYKWGRGDADAGIRGWSYKRLLAIYGGSPAIVAVLLALAPGFSWLGLLPVVADTVRRTRYKYRWAPRPAGFLLIPLAHLVASYSSLMGFLLGFARRIR